MEIAGNLNYFYIFIVSGCIISFTLAFISITIGLLAYVKVMAMEKSTHQIQYVPIDEEIDKHNQELLNKGWGTSEESIEKQENMFKDELLDKMPEFAVPDEEKKPYSF